MISLGAGLAPSSTIAMNPIVHCRSGRPTMKPGVPHEPGVKRNRRSFGSGGGGRRSARVVDVDPVDPANRVSVCDRVAEARRSLAVREVEIVLGKRARFGSLKLQGVAPFVLPSQYRTATSSWAFVKVRPSIAASHVFDPPTLVSKHLVRAATVIEKPVVLPSRARTNSAHTHSMTSPVSATNGSPARAIPMIWLDLDARLRGHVVEVEPEAAEDRPDLVFPSLHVRPETT